MDFLSLYNLVSNKIMKKDRSANSTSGIETAARRIDKFNSVGKNSIKSKTRDSIAQYPILASESLSTENKILIMHALEVHNASLVSMLLNNTARIDANTAGDVVRDFHSDLGVTDALADLFEGVELDSYFEEVNKELLMTMEDKVRKESINETTYTRDMRQIVNEAKDGFTTKASVIDKDIKTANDMTPTIVNVDVNMTSVDGSEKSVVKTLKIGVKCVLHSLTKDEIEYHLARAVYKDTPLMKIIKWTTGETKFFKDLMLALKDTKKAALNGDALKRLELIANTAKGSALAGKNFAPTAITTLLISKTDVDNIKYKHGIDLIGRPENVDKIFKRFLLMNFLIVDEALDIVYMYDEFRKSLDRYPMRSFERVSKIRQIKPDEVYDFRK